MNCRFLNWRRNYKISLWENPMGSSSKSSITYNGVTGFPAQWAGAHMLLEVYFPCNGARSGQTEQRASFGTYWDLLRGPERYTLDQLQVKTGREDEDEHRGRGGTCKGEKWRPCWGLSTAYKQAMRAATSSMGSCCESGRGLRWAAYSDANLSASKQQIHSVDLCWGWSLTHRWNRKCLGWLVQKSPACCREARWQLRYQHGGTSWTPDF